LQILERYDLAAASEADRSHLVVEALRRGFHDRARYMGDSDFVTVPEIRLRSREYADQRAAGIDPTRATSSAELAAPPAARDGENTTHFSIVDADGNSVAATLSVNGPFGAATVAGASGVLLNNTMNDFALTPEASNLYGLAGSRANLIAPGKRPLSSMSPSFVEDKRGVQVLGTPGGSRIISMVVLGALEFAAGKPPRDWVTRPRFHHQYLPDVIQFEPGAIDAMTQEDLRALGHTLSEQAQTYGNMQAVQWHKRTGQVDAASDPRGVGGAEVRAIAPMNHQDAKLP
ncbi:MAG: gamma-glutamyltransferase, partial [Gammaproteobacteria bacterium]|nr:gamma-glutamyltransferase [Gammaproteobacteria bacterium]